MPKLIPIRFETTEPYAFFVEAAPNSKKNKNKMSSDTGSVSPELRQTSDEKRDDETDVNDAFSGSCLSPDVKLFSLHVLQSSFVKPNTKHALNSTTAQHRPRLKHKSIAPKPSKIQQ